MLPTVGVQVPSAQIKSCALQTTHTAPQVHLLFASESLSDVNVQHIKVDLPSQVFGG